MTFTPGVSSKTTLSGGPVLAGVMSRKRHDVRRVTCLPAIGHNVWVGVHANTMDNLRRGMVERIYCVKKGEKLAPPPRPLKGVFKSRLAEFQRELRRVSPKLNRMSYEEFLGCCPVKKRKVYARAVESLRLEAVTERDARLKAFLKGEKITRDSAPRMIQPRDPRYNVEVGRYVRAIEGVMYKCIERVFGDVTVFKGMNAIECGTVLERKWNRIRNPVAVSLDASRFDQHVSVDALECTHETYLPFFPKYEHKRLMKLLSWQINNVGTAICKEGIIRYKVRGCRMSGDMDTSLGNCLLMCAMVWTYLREKGVAKYELVNNGDDCVVILGEEDLGKFSTGLEAWFLEMGFSMNAELPVRELERIEFCQGNPVLVGGIRMMVRKPHPGIAKDCTTLLTLNTPVEVKSWLSARGGAGMSLAGGVPVYQELYRWMLTVGENRKVSAQFRELVVSNTSKYWGHGMHGQYTASISAETRYSFFVAFGILPDMQIALEAEIRRMPHPELAPFGPVNVAPTLTYNKYLRHTNK